MMNSLPRWFGRKKSKDGGGGGKEAPLQSSVASEKLGKFAESSRIRRKQIGIFDENCRQSCQRVSQNGENYSHSQPFGDSDQTV